MHHILSDRIDQNMITFDKFQFLTKNFASTDELNELKKKLELFEKEYLNNSSSSDSFFKEDLELSNLKIEDINQPLTQPIVIKEGIRTQVSSPVNVV